MLRKFYWTENIHRRSPDNTRPTRLAGWYYIFHTMEEDASPRSSGSSICSGSEEQLC